MVEAAGRLIRSFRNGPDYAFIPVRPGAGRERSVLFLKPIRNPSARPLLIAAGESMSLYGAGLGLAPSRPLGVTACRCCQRRQASPM